MCIQILPGQHTCFVCGQPSVDTIRCTASPPCGRFYHLACALKLPQTRFEKNRLTCPLHTCATCFANADDDEDDLRREATRGK
jgi:[histone H3]-lysine36 N-dimethyltransferase NSD2